MGTKRPDCKYGFSTGDCTKADERLVQLGKPTLTCDECSVENVAGELLEQYPDLDGQERRVVHAWFEELGLNELVTLINYKLPPMENKFTCPVLNAPLMTPCQLKSCKFNVNYSWSNNCLLSYMHEQDKQTLSLEEISFLYGIPIDDVTEIYREAIYNLRSGAISVESAHDDKLKPAFAFFPTRGVCCVCESRIETTSPQLQLKNNDLAYCSKECKQEKPPRLIELEAQYGLEIGKVLEWVFTNFRSLTLAEQALNLPRWLAYYACKTFLGYELQEYFSSLKKIKSNHKRKLVRRTWHKPTKVDKLLTGLMQTRDVVYERYGQPVLQSGRITDLVDEIVDG